MFKDVYQALVRLLCTVIYPVVSLLAIVEAMAKLKSGYHLPVQKYTYPKNGVHFEIFAKVDSGKTGTLKWVFGEIGQMIAFKTGLEVPNFNHITRSSWWKLLKKFKII